MEVHNEKSLVNLSNSILKNFNVTTFHETIKEVDDVLKGHKKVVAVLFDGMGQNIVRKYLKENSFIRKHYVTTINSTFPPTTAAATTAFLSGKYPIETGWLGWNTYFKDYDRNIILFRSLDYNTGELLIKEGENSIAETYFPVNRLFELIEKNNPNTKAFNISRYPVQEDGPKTLLHQGIKKLNRVLRENNECFVYFYWDSPDREMHENGIDSYKVKYQVKKAQRFLKKAFKDNPDTLFIFLADHGHINVKYIDICDNEKLYSLIDKPLSLEKRAASIFVKKGQEKTFEELFNKDYGQFFELISKEKALEIKLFGEGTPKEGAVDTLGDYIAISKREYCLIASKELHHLDTFKGHHAGGTKEERLIDISIFTN